MKIKVTKDFMDMMQPESKLCVFYREGNPNNKLIEIRAVVDGDWIVFNRDGGGYYIENIYFFWLQYEKGVLKRR